MNNNIVSNLVTLGFTKMLDNLYTLSLPNVLNATNQNIQVFVYEEDEKFYLSDNGDLVEEFDTVNINLDKALIEIENILNGFNCKLSESKIVKEIDISNIKKELKSFLHAITQVDLLYKNI